MFDQFFISIITLIFFLVNCGFTPIYLMNTDINFSIEKVNYTGDKELNNFLKINSRFLFVKMIYYL